MDWGEKHVHSLFLEVLFLNCCSGPLPVCPLFSVVTRVLMAIGPRTKKQRYLMLVLYHARMLPTSCKRNGSYSNTPVHANAIFYRFSPVGYFSIVLYFTIEALTRMVIKSHFSIFHVMGCQILL